MKINGLCAVFLAGTLMLAGCGSVGHDFDLSQTEHISQGTTTQQDIQSMFGEPFRTGVQNGHPVWVYEKSTYSALGKDKTKSLIVEFDDKGVVRKYQVMSNLSDNK